MGLDIPWVRNELARFLHLTDHEPPQPPRTGSAAPAFPGSRSTHGSQAGIVASAHGVPPAALSSVVDSPELAASLEQGTPIASTPSPALQLDAPDPAHLRL
jgi:hypothetical protein